MKKTMLLFSFFFSLSAASIHIPSPAGGSPSLKPQTSEESIATFHTKRRREYLSTWQTAMNFLEEKYGPEINHIIDIEGNLKALYPLGDIHSSEIAPFEAPKMLLCEVATYTIASQTTFLKSCNNLRAGLDKKLMTLFENNLRAGAILEKPYSSLEIKCALYSSLRGCFSEECISSWNGQIENLIKNKSFRGFISPTYISSHAQAVVFLRAITATILNI